MPDGLLVVVPWATLLGAVSVVLLEEHLVTMPTKTRNNASSVIGKVRTLDPARCNADVPSPSSPTSLPFTPQRPSCLNCEHVKLVDGGKGSPMHKLLKPYNVLWERTLLASADEFLFLYGQAGLPPTEYTVVICPVFSLLTTSYSSAVLSYGFM
ncbi:hypothetical protein K435DRAFT_802977 [Dendrothele bispora CBS 962.96]|uniref:Uncharacterized protein n=1 Tax=Dendrothele bispora (strain CBS 962.96) TaxID=1314807 RepID=A0A4S8LJD7_DENBC|nr:hypothetical protein K435DRAFT_802977 [Dendrothele bispora CBS 962.96]